MRGFCKPTFAKFAVFITMVIVTSLVFSGCQSYKPCKKESIPVDTSKNMMMDGNSHEA